MEDLQDKLRELQVCIGFESDLVGDIVNSDKEIQFFFDNQLKLGMSFYKLKKEDNSYEYIKPYVRLTEKVDESDVRKWHAYEFNSAFGGFSITMFTKALIYGFIGPRVTKSGKEAIDELCKNYLN